MARSDQLDVKLAKHFAWRFALPGHPARLAEWIGAAERASGENAPGVGARDEESSPAAEPADDDAPAGDGFEPVTDDQARTREKARASCRALAEAVVEAWALPDADSSARATKRLLARADRMGPGVVWMAAHPQEAIRLLRLLVRHGASMTPRQREHAALVATFLPLAHAEWPELVVEVARAADLDMVHALLPDGDEGSGQARAEEWALGPGPANALAARLADVVESGPAHARAVAIDLIACLEKRDAAVPALRRALRYPSLGVRARALQALASTSPPELGEDDLVDVLRALAVQAPPSPGDEDREEGERVLADAIILALGHVRPSEAEEALLDLIDAERDAVWLDAGWATEALSVAFPDTAAAMVDHWLRCARAHERARALPALERLPDALAEPRLRVAANDPALIVREAARRQWLHRFERACPAEPGDICGVELLDAPPSDRFASRLAVMQGRVREARRAMARALLAEAPDAEALVLLLQLVGDDAESGEPSFSAASPPASGDAEAWAPLLVERFGALGVRGLCALAARFPEPESFGWMRRLGDLVERQAIERAHYAPLRAIAARHASADDSGRVDDSLRLLALVGAPPEMLDRVLGLALEDDIGASEARALVVSWPDRAVDARLTSEMALALAGRDWTRVHHAAWMALERGAPAARVIAQRVLEVAEHEPEAAEAAIECARRLRDAGLLDRAWVLSALARPESPIFVVAARAWRRDPIVRAPLEAALSSPARGGVSAAQAAISLLHGEPGLSPRDRRLSAVLEAVAASPRAELVHAMCMHGAPLALVGPHLAELLASTDPAVTGPLLGVAVWLASPRARALLAEILPRVIDADLRGDIEDALAGEESYRSLR